MELGGPPRSRSEERPFGFFSGFRDPRPDRRFRRPERGPRTDVDSIRANDPSSGHLGDLCYDFSLSTVRFGRIPTRVGSRAVLGPRRPVFVRSIDLDETRMSRTLDLRPMVGPPIPAPGSLTRAAFFRFLFCSVFGTRDRTGVSAVPSADPART